MPAKLANNMRPPGNTSSNKHQMSKIPFELQRFDLSTTEVPAITIAGDLNLNDNRIQVSYQLHGNIGRLLFPKPSKTASRKDKLWESTCFELFIAESGNAAYWEYNLSPSRDWAAFQFTNYRENKTNDLTIETLKIETSTDKTTRFELNASLTLAARLLGHRLCLGISAVLQDNSGKLYYYALTHRKRHPDFHDRSGFTITLEA